MKDPHAVTVFRGGTTEPLMRPGIEPSAQQVTSGQYWRFFSRTDFRVDALRDDAGALRLRCEACGDAGWPLSGVRETTLVAADGHVREPPMPLRFVGQRVVIPYDVCLVRSRRSFCRASAAVDLSFERAEVASLRVQEAPSRSWGGVLAANGLFAAVLGALVAPTVLARERPAVRVGVSVPLATVGVGLLALGGWHLFAPAHDLVVW